MLLKIFHHSGHRETQFHIGLPKAMVLPKREWDMSYLVIGLTLSMRRVINARFALGSRE